LNKVEKIILMPFVVVYKNALGNHKDILNTIKESESKTEEGIISVWESWYDFGTMSRMTGQPTLIGAESDNSSVYLKEKKVYDDVYSIINEAYDDYISEWTKKETVSMYRSNNESHWKEVFGGIVDNWDYRNHKAEITEFDGDCKTVMNFTKESGWLDTAIDIAKHKPNTNREYAIGYHLDSNGEIVNPGPKAILTSTIYLNDEYEGGGVSFLNEFDSTIVNYKPTAGDLVIFPSAKPFFHAALPLSGDASKYFIRHFLTWKHKGLQAWFDGIEKYGIDAWLEIRTQVYAAEVAMGFYEKDVHIEGNKIDPRASRYGLPFFATKIIEMR
jgi:hypothetical protein